MDYEKENAKEWQMDAGAGSSLKAPEPDTSDEDYADYAEYVQAQYNTDEMSDAALASGWKAVSHKKQPAKLPTKPPARVPATLSGRPRGQPPGRPSARLSAAPFSRQPPRQSSQPNVPLPPRGTLIKTAASSRPPPPVQSRPPPPVQSRPPPPVQLAPTPPRQRARPKVTFTTERDNPAKAAFRENHPHTDTFLLPKACHLIEPNRPTMYAIMEEMGVRLGSFIRPPQHLHDQTLLLWGDEEQVKATKEELGLWIRESVTAARSSQAGGPLFAKASQLGEDRAKKLDKEYRRDMERQAFQKAPPPNMSFNFTGWFLWPVDEIRPEDLLGPSFEAFDHIRMLHCAYIVFDYQRSVFKIMSDKMDGVKDAIQRITGTMKEYVARSSQDIVLHMVEVPKAVDMRKDIKTSNVLSIPHFEGALIPLLTGAKLTHDELANWEMQRGKLTDEQFEKTKNAILKGLSRTRYYRGRLKMRVLLGTFALTTFRRLPEGVESIPYDRFISDMNMSATKGRMIKE